MEGDNGTLKAKEPFDSNCNKVMLVLRIIAIVAFTTCLVYSFANYGADVFLYLTYWALMLSIAIFVFILIPNKSALWTRILESGLCAVWLVELMLTILFWVFLSGDLSTDNIPKLLNSVSIHSLPFIFLSVEILSNKVVVQRLYTLYAIALFFGYFLIINLPYTLAVRVLYNNLTYTNWFTYISLIGSLVALLVFGEMLYWIKRKILEKDTEKSENISVPLLNP